jgi:hypothetical protein
MMYENDVNLEFKSKCISKIYTLAVRKLDFNKSIRIMSSFKKFKTFLCLFYVFFLYYEEFFSILNVINIWNFQIIL